MEPDAAAIWLKLWDTAKIFFLYCHSLRLCIYQPSLGSIVEDVWVTVGLSYKVRHGWFYLYIYSYAVNVQTRLWVITRFAWSCSHHSSPVVHEVCLLQRYYIGCEALLDSLIRVLCSWECILIFCTAVRRLINDFLPSVCRGGLVVVVRFFEPIVFVYSWTEFDLGNSLELLMGYLLAQYHRRNTSSRWGRLLDYLDKLSLHWKRQWLFAA